MKLAKEYVELIWWSLRINWQAGGWVYLASSAYNVVDIAFLTILNTYLVAQLTASVAKLAAGQVDASVAIMFSIAIAALAIFKAILSRVKSFYDSKIGDNNSIVITDIFLRSIDRLCQEQLDDDNIQKKIVIAKQNSYALSQLSNSTIELISQLVAFVTAIVVLSRFSLFITIVLIVLAPLLLWINIKRSNLQYESWEENSTNWRLRWHSRETLADTSNYFQYTILGARDRLFELWKNFEIVARDIELKTLKKTNLLDLAESLTREVVGLFAYIWIIMLVAKHKLAFNNFLFSLGLVQQAVSATWLVSYNVRSMQEGVIAGRAAKELINLPPTRPDGDLLLENKDEGLAIDIDKVFFGYNEASYVLEDINLQIAKGEHIAIVGENGAGKTTLIRLILGQYAPSKGGISIDGNPIGSYQKASYIKRISVLFQDYKLFPFLTIRQNLNIANKASISEAKLDDALDLVNLKTTVHKLKKSYDTRLDQSFKDGTNLSGGQLQRLAIARSFAKNSRLLILDEPTSAIDSRAEMQIFNNIFEHHSKSTIIIVSHRFSTIKKADRIIVLQNGKITEQGGHKELMKIDGHYSELYRIQAKDYQDEQPAK